MTEVDRHCGIDSSGRAEACREPSVVGLLMILLGLIWIAQGSGYFPYPASSFMINQSI
ncbi:hypothetical protein HFO96_16425 [Rhizobium leguminosarum]|nr:hypothetical protein [Rhizobium leguminosarum]